MADIIRLEAHVKEHLHRNLFLVAKKEHFSPDWIIFENGKLEFHEIKMQELFTAGSNFPFDGHGLPYSQYKRYMSVFNMYGIRTKIYIYDERGDIWSQYIDVLYNCPREWKYYCQHRSRMIFAIYAYNHEGKHDKN